MPEYRIVGTALWVFFLIMHRNTLVTFLYQPLRLFRLVSGRGACVAGLVLFLALCQQGQAAAPSVSELEKRIAAENRRTTERRNTLKRLTRQEQQLDANLAAAEKRINSIEERLDELQNQFASLAKSDTQAAKEYEVLLEEQKKTRAAQEEITCLLWQVACKKESVGNRDMLDWAASDREHRWSVALLKAFSAYGKELAGHQAKLENVLARRTQYSKEIAANIEKADAEKEKLLKSRLDYDKRLSAVRNEKKDAEDEIAELLRLVESLNFQLEEAGGAIERQKGRLPWPVIGPVKLSYAPAAGRRGLGIGAAEGSPVKAVAAGKILHNDIVRGFGTVLIVQHGDEYYSLYAFLGSSPLGVGQQVARGQEIGKVGFYPAIHEPGMYFELRFRQKAINPEQWLAPKRG